MEKGMTYASAGVNISAGNFFAEMIKKRVSAAWPERDNEIGGFAGGGPIPSGATIVKGSTDGTGTVALLAAMLKKYDSIGFNACAMGAVDTYVSGARPAYLLDTLNVGHLVPRDHIQIIDSLIAACKKAGCVLIGGETAEVPDMHRYPWVFNLDVAVIGFPDPDLAYVPVRVGQKVYGSLSYGPGSNGFSLLRKVHGLKIKEDFWFHLRQAFKLKNKSLAKVVDNLTRPQPELGGKTLADALLVPTPIWIPEIEAQRKRGVRFSGIAHITGGGLVENIPRILPQGFGVFIDKNAWKRPQIFRFTQDVGSISNEEMNRTFNQGIMLVYFIDPDGPLPDSSNFIEIGEIRHCQDHTDKVIFTGKHLEE